MRAQKEEGHASPHEPSTPPGAEPLALGKVVGGRHAVAVRAADVDRVRRGRRPRKGSRRWSRSKTRKKLGADLRHLPAHLGLGVARRLTARGRVRRVVAPHGGGRLDVGDGGGGGREEAEASVVVEVLFMTKAPRCRERSPRRTPRTRARCSPMNPRVAVAPHGHVHGCPAARRLKRHVSIRFSRNSASAGPHTSGDVAARHRPASPPRARPPSREEVRRTPPESRRPSRDDLDRDARPRATAAASARASSRRSRCRDRPFERQSCRKPRHPGAAGRVRLVATRMSRRAPG